MHIDRIRELREDQDWTQQELADFLHINRRTYSAYETGTNAVPLDILIKLAQLYGVSADYLLGAAPRSGGEALCRKMRILRERRGLGQDTLANLLRVTPAAYARYENGSMDVPAAFVPLLSAFYGVSADDLLGASPPHKFSVPRPE